MHDVALGYLCTIGGSSACAVAVLSDRKNGATRRIHHDVVRNVSLLFQQGSVDKLPYDLCDVQNATDPRLLLTFGLMIGAQARYARIQPGVTRCHVESGFYDTLTGGKPLEG